MPYPVACQPQAWAAGAIPYLVTGGLGLVPDALEKRLRVRRPSLPHWLSRVEVRNLRIAGATVDLLFERTGVGDQVALVDARIDGDVEVVLEISGSRTPVERHGAAPSQPCSSAQRAPTVHACTRLATGTGSSAPPAPTA